MRRGRSARVETAAAAGFHHEARVESESHPRFADTKGAAAMELHRCMPKESAAHRDGRFTHRVVGRAGRPPPPAALSQGRRPGNSFRHMDEDAPMISRLSLLFLAAI